MFLLTVIDLGDLLTDWLSWWLTDDLTGRMTDVGGWLTDFDYWFTDWSWWLSVWPSDWLTDGLTQFPALNLMLLNQLSFTGFLIFGLFSCHFSRIARKFSRSPLFRTSSFTIENKSPDGATRWNCQYNVVRSLFSVCTKQQKKTHAHNDSKHN